jgi:hypothetical protein
MSHCHLFIFLTIIILSSSYEWVQVAPSNPNITGGGQRYKKILIPVNNYNYNGGTYYEEDVFVSPYWALTDVDFTYELCSTISAKVKKDIPSIFNNTSIPNPCAVYFCGHNIPFYLIRTVNNTNNMTHFAVQTLCTQCDSTREEGFSISTAMNGTCHWYDTRRCGYQNQTNTLCMMYYPLALVSLVSTKLISYFWEYEAYVIGMDHGLWLLLGYFHYASRILYISLSLLGLTALTFLFVIPEVLLRIYYRKDSWKDEIIATFSMRNAIFVLISIGSLSMFTGSIISFAQDNTIGLSTTGASTYTQLGLTLFAFTLVIIQWKHIAEATELDQPFSSMNKVWIFCSFVTFFIWASLLVTSFVTSTVLKNSLAANFVYATSLFGVSVIFGILALIVVIVGLVLTKRYLGGNLCNLDNIETLQMYKLKFTQIMIITSITLFFLVYVAFYNGLTLWTSRDILGIRFYYLYRAQLAFVTQFLSLCLIFTIVDLRRSVKKGYMCGRFIEDYD